MLVGIFIAALLVLALRGHVTSHYTYKVMLAVAAAIAKVLFDI